MAQQDIEVIEDNDSAIIFTCKLDGAAVNLTGALIEMFIKPTKQTAEDDPDVIRYATDTATPAITILNQSGATLGQCRVQMNRADLASPAKKKYRLDVTQAGQRLTYAYGSIAIKDV